MDRGGRERTARKIEGEKRVSKERNRGGEKMRGRAKSKENDDVKIRERLKCVLFLLFVFY